MTPKPQTLTQMQPEMPPKGFKTVICKFWENNMCAKGAGKPSTLNPKPYLNPEP